MKTYLFLVIIVLSACKNVATSAPEEHKKKSVAVNTQKDSLMVRLEIDFYSIASGIDYPAMIAFEDSIGSYSERIKKNIDYRKSSWGREGETEFCLTLKELTPTEQTDFIEQTRNWLKNAKWVHINENARCRH